MNGPESFTPDNNFIMGEAPELKNFFVAAGFNSIGIASGGGAGQALAEWIVEGEPSLDLWPVDIRRFARFHDDDAFLKERVSEVLGLHYKMPWPNRELTSARPQRTSPLYDRLKGKHALFGSRWVGSAELLRRVGRRRAARYSSTGRTGSRMRPPSRASRGGCRCFRSHIVLEIPAAGFRRRARAAHLCANDMAVPAGTTVYTGLLNARGTYESDLTVRAAGRRPFFHVTGTAQTTRDADWIAATSAGARRSWRRTADTPCSP